MCYYKLEYMVKKSDQLLFQNQNAWEEIMPHICSIESFHYSQIDPKLQNDLSL
jgi:hypothetical protein